jgi:predicted GIY-YIG superfamily endonuclease
LHHAAHYAGWTQDLEARLEEHRKGQGARLLAVLKEKGIDWVLARTWDGKTKAFERRLKKGRLGSKRSLCPICSKKGESNEPTDAPTDTPTPNTKAKRSSR